MSLGAALKGFLAEIADGYVIKRRVIRWEPEHAGMTVGRNGFCDDFYLHDRVRGNPPYPEDRWHMDVHPPCPDGKRFCSCREETLYKGPDHSAAIAKAQEWSDREHGLVRDQP